MSDQSEQIGVLVYLINPSYPYPFPVEKPPHYWMTETTGKLEEAVEAYFAGEALESAHIALIKQYLRQYLERAVLTGDANRAALLRQFDGLRTGREIERFVEEIAEYGIEPL